jgi:hypothetical protein
MTEIKGIRGIRPHSKIALYVVGWLVLAFVAVGFRDWQVRCKVESERCSREAAKWERIALGCKEVATMRSRQAIELPGEASTYLRWERENSHLAERASEIARRFRAAEVRSRFGLGVRDGDEPVAELWRRLE